MHWTSCVPELVGEENGPRFGPDYTGARALSRRQLVMLIRRYDLSIEEDK